MFLYSMKLVTLENYALFAANITGPLTQINLPAVNQIMKDARRLHLLTIRLHVEGIVLLKCERLFYPFLKDMGMNGSSLIQLCPDGETTYTSQVPA
jgi:hypothetical protein